MTVGAPPAAGPPAMWPAVRRRSQTDAGTFVALAVLGVLALVAVALMGWQVGATVLPVAALLALVPLVVVLLAIVWVDRWEPEPWPALAVAFAWGASVSVIVALVLNTGVMVVLAALSSDAEVTVVSASVVAPVVEESIKGLGVVVCALVWRRFFDGPVDGLVYAATVAAGFAFVENILYFGQTIASTAGVADSGPGVAGVFFLRAVMSPFAHVLFTACTGVAVGLAAQSRSRLAWLWALPVGLLLAMTLHGLWNSSAMLGDGSGFFVLYAAVQAPVFVCAVVLAFLLRRREAAVVRDRLGELVPGGWFHPQEVRMLTCLAQRRAARGWARRHGGVAGARAMRAFQVTATRLAFQRQRALTRRADLHARWDEMGLLADLAAARDGLARTLAV